MTQFNAFEINESTRKRYFDGWKNKLIRIYYYIKTGLNVVNEWKYIAVGIIALAVLLKLDGIRWLIGMGVISVPILLVIGYLWAHKVEKRFEWFNIEFTTHFSKRNYALQERQTKALEDILENLQ